MLIPNPFTERVNQTEPLNAARLCLRGEGPVGNDPLGPKLFFNHAGDGIVLGAGDPFRATGGRLRDFGIIKGKGHKGGIALRVTAYTKSDRSGENIFENLLTLAEPDLDGKGEAYWRDGWVVEGDSLQDTNAAGSRQNKFLGGRIAGCLNDAIRLQNAVHCWVVNTQVDPGRAKNIPTVRIVGGDHVFLTGVNITGRIIIEGGAKNVLVDGFAQQVVIRSGCRNVTVRGIVEQSLVIEPDVTGRCDALTAAVVNQSPKSFVLH